MSLKNRKYGIIHNLKQDIDALQFLDFFDWMNEKEYLFYFNKDISIPNGKKISYDILTNKEIIELCDIIIVFGGDGSVLEIAKFINDTQKDILGVNFGKLGFLTDIVFKDLKYYIGKIEKKEFEIEERVFLKAEFGNNQVLAINDIIINKGRTTKAIKLEVYVDKKYVVTYSADGLIIATPTGSTAYNLSNHGPVVSNFVNALILTAVAPHALAIRPIIISDKSEIEIIPVSQYADIAISGDATKNSFSKSGKPIIIKTTDYKARFIKFKENDFYKMLREKLGWGGFKKRDFKILN